MTTLNLQDYALNDLSGTKKIVMPTSSQGPQSYVNGTENYVPTAPLENTQPSRPATPTVGSVMGTKPTSTLDSLRAQAEAIKAQIPGATGYTKPFNAPTAEEAPADPWAPMTPAEERRIQREQMKLFQKEIDATNQIYDEMIRGERLAGEGRLGSVGAMGARAGILGSDFQGAQEESTRRETAAIIGGVQAERQAKVSAIMGLGRKAAVDEIAAKNKANKEGAEAKIKFMSEKKDRMNRNLNKLAASLIEQGIDPDELSKEELDDIVKSYGTTAEDIKATYASKKFEQEANKKDTTFTLGEGQARYDAEGNVIASRPKTYAPKDSTSSDSVDGDYVPGQDSVTDSWVSRINRGEAKITNVPSKYKNKVIVALEQSTGVTLDEDVQTANEIKRLAEELINDKEGLSDSVGTLSSKLPTIEGSTATYERKLERLKALISKSNLQTMRGLGSMSNIEFQNMQAIGSALDTNMGEAGFGEELQRIIDTTGNAVSASPSKETAGAVITNPATGESYDASDLTAEEYQQALNDGFEPG